MTGPALHERFPALAESLPHVELGDRPTPVRKLDGLSADSFELWLKDDGAYGRGAWGGNKVRKLEWLIPDARRRGARRVLTFGGLGTNHGLATALYCAEHGLATAIALVDQPVDEHVEAQQRRLRASGADLHYTHTKARTIATVPWLLGRYAAAERRLPYVMPVGGSSPYGALGYVEGGLEIAAQVDAGELPEPSHVFVALGSGGTAAGLALGLRIAGLRSRVVGIVVNDKLRLDARAIAKLANRSAGLLRERGADLDAGLRIEAGDLDTPTEWLGDGYGSRTEEAERAREHVASAEGLQLDPVYTGKAMAALLAMGRRGGLGRGPVLFVHTDGPR